MVVVTIISILAGVATYASLQSGQKSRDAKRQADLTLLQGAVELYKNKYGRYPEGCNAVGGWSGQIGSDYDCPDGSNRYILGANNRWFNEFMTALPLDKKMNGTNSGYVYQTNNDGTVYKIKAHRTVESEVVTYAHKFKPCDIRSESAANGSLVNTSRDREIVGWCARVRTPNDNSAEQSPPTTCRVQAGNLDFTGSYGVWGGFKPKRTIPASDTCAGPPVAVNCVSVLVWDTTSVTCK